MGMFKIEITAIGGHGVDRIKKDGEIVDFMKDGIATPDGIAKSMVEELQKIGVYFGSPGCSATITHWPGEPTEVKDDLLTGERKGNF